MAPIFAALARRRGDPSNGTLQYDDHPETELEALLEARARARGCELAIGEKADGWIAAFEQDDPVGAGIEIRTVTGGERS